MFSIKEDVLTIQESKKMKNVLAMEIPLESGGNFRLESCSATYSFVPALTTVSCIGQSLFSPLSYSRNCFRYEGSTPYEAEDMYETWAALVDKKTGHATLYTTDVFHMMPRSNG